MSWAFHTVFILALMAHVAKGLPTTKQTAIERPILKKSQPTIGEPSASRWPSLAEVITNAEKVIKPSTSLLDMLQNEEKVKIKIDTTAAAVSDVTTSFQNQHAANKVHLTTPMYLKENKALAQPVTMASTASQFTEKNSEKIPATVIDVAEFGSITDFGWNEDNIKLDFITVNDLRRLIEKAGGKLDHSLYAQSATHVGSLSHQDKIKVGIIKTTRTSSTSTSTTSSNTLPSTTSAATTAATTTAASVSTATTRSSTSSVRRRKFSTSWLPSVSFNVTVSSTTTESTPYPPLTLSLGSWQITEEDLPIYVGSAAGVLLLIILLLGVTTWRCSTVPSSLSTTSNQSPTKSAREDTGSSPTSQNNNGQQQQQQRQPLRPLTQQQPLQTRQPQPSQRLVSVESPNGNGEAPLQQPPTLPAPIVDYQQQSASGTVGHDSMVCLSGTRVESRIVSPGHSKSGGKVVKQSPVATLTQRRTTPFDANCSPTHVNSVAKLDVCDELQVVNNPGTYVRVPPIDNFVSTSNGATTFHTFQPNNSRSTSDKNSSTSSPDDAGFISTAGNKGSSVSTPGTVRSTPSSEALDVVGDLRYESMRFRSLPVSHKNDTYSKETNGNLFDGPIDLPSLDSPPARPPSCIPPLPGPKHYQSPVFNGNANTTAQNVEDMYAKVNFTAKSCKSRNSPTSGQVAVVQPLTMNRIAQKIIHSPGNSAGTGTVGNGSSSGVMTTFVPKINPPNCNMMMMTSSTIVTSFDETDDLTETEAENDSCHSDSQQHAGHQQLNSELVGQLASKTATALNNFSRMSSEETSSLFYSTKTSL